MGTIINGNWRPDVGMDDVFVDGEFVRPPSEITGSVAPSDVATGRYHLYAMIGCPWAHRALLMRAVKGLDAAVSLSLLEPRMGPQGWQFGDDYPDHVGGKRYLHQVYTAGTRGYTGRCTVPVLWDKQRGSIVSNDSADIMRMFNGVFDAVATNHTDYYPAAKRAEIDAVNERVFAGLNNGVYRAGFARTQLAHDRAVDVVFETLAWMETRLAKRRYLCGEVVTEADWRAFPTLIRFDVAYHSAFGCSKRRLVDYPRLWALTKELYAHPGVSETVDLKAYHRGYHSIPIAVGHRKILPPMPELGLR